MSCEGCGSVTQARQSQLQAQIAIAILARRQQAERAQGEAIVSLLRSSAERPAAQGKGGGVDLDA
jgi:hypothetical protein